MGNFDKVLWAILGLAALAGGSIWLWASELTSSISDPTNQGWIGFVGLYLTLVGLALAWHQLWKVRSAAVAVQVSSAALIKQVQSSTRMFEAAELKREIQLFKANVQRQELESALQSLDTVKGRLAFLKETVADNSGIVKVLQDQSFRLGQIEAVLRASHIKSGKLPDPVRLVIDISGMEDVIMSYAAKFALSSRTESHVKVA